MASCWDDVVGGYETFVKEQKDEDGKCTFSLTAFDTKIVTPLDFADIKVVTESLDELDINPRGMTALYDAVGRTVNEIGKKLRNMPESDRPGKVLIVVQTDGLNNASEEFTAGMIKEMVQKQTDKYNWKFMFVGADEASVLDAQNNLGFSVDLSSSYKTANTKDFFTTMSNKTKTLRAAADASAVDLSYSTEERALLNK
jgi:hypothetical protein